jgi:uncharacterized protein
MIDRAEQLIRALGIPVCRVRYRTGDVASIEVPTESIPIVQQPTTFVRLADEFCQLGFESVEVDPRGFRSGSLNESLAVHQIDLSPSN